VSSAPVGSGLASPGPTSPGPTSPGPTSPSSADRRAGGGATPSGRARRAVAGVVAVVLLAAAAASSGLAVAEGDPVGAVLPVVLLGGLVLVALAATRVLAVVLVLLVARTSLDVVRLSGGGAARALDPAVLVSVLLLAVTAAWFVAQRSGGRAERGSPLRTALLALVAAAGLSLLGAEQPARGAVELLRLSSAVAMLVLLEQLVTTRRRLVAVLGAVAAGALVPLLVGVGQVLGVVGGLSGDAGGGPAGLLGRLTGPFDHPTTYARYLLVVVLLGLAVLPVVRRRAARWSLAGAVALGGLLLVATLTRGALVAGLVGALVLVVVQRRPGLLLGLVAVGAAAVVAVPGAAARFAAAGSSSGDSLSWRLQYWAELLPLARQRPLTGIGFDGVRGLTEAAKLPHNDALRMLVETGVLGLLAYAAVLLSLVGVGLRAVRRTRAGSLEHATGAAATAVAAAVVVASSAANLITGVVVLWYVMALAACAVAVGRRPLPDDSPRAGQAAAGAPARERPGPAGAPAG